MQLPFKNLGDCLRLDAEPERAAIVEMSVEGTAGMQLSAREFDGQVNRVALRLQNRGVEVGHRVLLHGYNSLNYLVAYLAVLRLGAVAVPLNPGLPSSTVTHVLKDAACQWAFTLSESLLGFESLTVLSLKDSALFEQDEKIPEFSCFEPAESDIAEILYTSGSTGMPKGVPLTHHGQCWALGYYLQDIASEAQRRIAVATPLYHMNGLFLTTMALANRMLVHLIPRFNADAWLRVIVTEKVDYVTGVPTMFALAAQSKDQPPAHAMDHVSDVFLGSSPVSEALVDQVESLFPKASIRNSYGTTEAGPIVFGAHPEGLVRPPTSVGYPIEGIEWRFSNGSSTEGPLELRTPAVSPGYLNRDDATAKAFQKGWYRTFDIMRRDDNGFFYFVGREDDMFVCGGENIFPGQVETLLEQHPAIAQAAVIPMEHASKGQAPAAFVVLRPGQHADEDGVKRFCLDEGPAFAHPRKVLFLDQLPLGGTRKVDKHALRAMLSG